MSTNVDDPSRFSQDAPEPARRLWQMWQRETSPDLAQFIKDLKACTPALLAAIVCVDLRERWRRQIRVPVEDYLRQYPQLQAERESALDVVYCEYLLRDGMGEAPTAAEYRARFPDLGKELAQQIEMHRLLEDSNQLTAIHEPDGWAKTTVQDKRPRVDKPGNWPTIPGYEILGRLGRGGMGVVYKAWQDRLYRIVAIKMVQASDADAPQALARFQTEGQAVARLQHPNIVQIYEVGEYDGSPFLVMEFADAGSLAQKLNGTPWPARDAAVLLEKLARAVHYAHQRGVLHRDLTPGNVVLFTDGTPKLSDFGLAKLLVGGTPVTETGAVVGTPSYMSPEQASGGGRTSGPAVDIYALGAMLFELLTGRPPFKAATPLETLAQVVHIDPVPPRQLQPNVPRDLETICLKCLRKEPTRRYTTAGELADDLQHFLKNEPIQARPVGPVERVWRWGRRNPGWAAALVLLLFTAIGAVIAAHHLAGALQESEQAHEQAKRKLYRSRVDEARAKRLSNRPGQRQLSLALLDEARNLAGQLKLGQAEFDRLRNEIVACLALPDLELVREWDGFPAGSFSVDFDDGMNLYARADTQGNVSVRRIADDVELASLPGTKEPALVRFSPDAQRLAVVSERNLRLWRIDDKTPIIDTSIGKHELGVSRFAFGMQGEQLAVIQGGAATIILFNAKTGAEIERVQLGEKIGKLAFHPVQPLLALTAGKAILLYDLKDKKSRARLELPENACAVAWSGDGRVLAAGCDDKIIRVWDAASVLGSAGEPRLINKFTGPNTQGMEITLNHAGTILASTNSYLTLRLWNVHGGQQLLMPISEGGMHRFAGADDRLACGGPGSKLRLYRTILGSEFRRLPAYTRYHQAGARSVVFQPNGRLLFASGENGLTLLDPVSTAITTLPHKGWMMPVAFDAHAALITASAAGYQSWPNADRGAWTVDREPTGDNSRSTVHGPIIRLGPPKLLARGANGFRAAFAADGRALAIPDVENGARITVLDQPGQDVRLGPQKDVRCCDISPDGRWVVTGTYSDPGQPGAVVWNARTGERAADIPAVPRFCDVAFSPDGRWLITSGGGCRLWDVGTWKPGPDLGGAAFAFATDGKLLAVEGEEGQVRLVDPNTGSDHVILTAPGESHSLPCCFSPDGSLLVVFGTESQALHVWDLRAVRAHLSKQGLDWHLPPLPPPANNAEPPQVELVERPSR